MSTCFASQFMWGFNLKLKTKLGFKFNSWDYMSKYLISFKRGKICFFHTPEIILKYNINRF